MQLVRRLGQLGLGAMFIKLGSDAAREPGARPEKAAAIGVPQPELAVRANGTIMTVAGWMLATDRWPRLAALLLAASLVPTTLAGHPFWEAPPGPERTGNTIHFLKNLGLVGGLLVAAGTSRD